MTEENSKKIAVIYGKNPKEMTKNIMETLSFYKKLTSKTKIGIKPNLIKDSPSNLGATTSPEVVAGIIEYLRDYGYSDIVVLESSALGYDTDRAFSKCGYENLRSKYNIKLLNLKNDGIMQVRAAGMDLKICKSVFQLDCLINVPVLKAHCQTKLTCALKNLKGCLPDSEKRRFHFEGLHRPIAALNVAIKTDFTVIDAICGDLTFEEGGNPVVMDCLIAGYDPVLIDAYAAETIGLDPHLIQYITLAEKYGVGSMNLKEAKVLEIELSRKPIHAASASPIARQLDRYIEELSACSICYSSLIHALVRLQDEGLLGQLSEKNVKIKVGQGYKNKTKAGIGIGNCTSGTDKNLSGCPPKAKDILEFLKKEIL